MDAQGFLTPDRIVYATADNPIVGRPRRRDTPAWLSDSSFIRRTWIPTWEAPLAAGGHRRGSKRARVADTSEAVLGLQEVTGRRDECAICLNDFGAEETLRAMPCSHAFHQQCIAEWLRRSAVCPLCRHRLPTAPTAPEEEEEDVEEEEEEENVEEEEEEEEEEDDGEDGEEWVDGAIGGESPLPTRPSEEKFCFFSS